MSYRSHFALPDPPETVELRAFTHGLMPKTVPDMMERFTQDWKQRGVDAWNEVPNHWRPNSDEQVGWWTLPEYLADHFVAPLLGAPEGTCILQPNVHWTLQCLLSAPEPFEDGKTDVVCSANEFPSVLHSAKQWTDLRDISTEVVPTNDSGYVDQDAILDAIGPSTAIVALSHVGFTTGERLPDEFLRRVADRVHDEGGLLLVDGYHATATMPIDVEAIGADLYVGGLLKEACGSSGTAFVYMRPDLELTPRLTGWFGDAAPFEFRQSPTPHPDVRRRFVGGTTSVASMYHAVEGARVLLDIGLETVRSHSLDLTEHALQRAEAADLPLRSPRARDRRGAMVLLEVPDAEKLCSYLKQHHIYTDSRKNRFLRMAPFIWNTHAEIDRTFDVIDDALDDERYRAIDLADEAAGPVT